MPNIAYLDFTYDKSSIMTDSVNMPLTFISRENNNTIKIIRENCPTNLYKSLDGGMTWSAVSYADNASLQYSGRELGTLNKGQYVMLKGSFNGAWNENPTSWNVSSFSSTGKFDIIGNIMSIAPGMTNNALPEISHIFDNIFSETKVVDASKLILPATTLYDYCYREMFRNCIYLTSAPKLPATILATECYGGMFNGCTSLVNMPDLSATSLATGCCIGMFENCTSLYEAPKLPATTLASSCYLNMFNGCTSMVKPPALPATTLAWGCYNGMFQGCTSITDAPELKAVTVPNYAYANMFYNCTSLNYIKIHATNREAQSIYNWVHNVAPTGIFIKHKNATYDIDSDSGVPIGWTVFDLDETIGEVYTVTISTTPSDTGSVIGAGRYRAGSTVTLTGQPATGYKVKQYSKYTSPTTTEVVSTYNNSYQFVIKEDTHILAEFELDSEFNDYESVYFTITSLEDNNSIYFQMENPDYSDLEEDDFELSYSINNRTWQTSTLTFDTESYSEPDENGNYDERNFRQKMLITTINNGETISFRADRDTYTTNTPSSGTMNISGINRFITSKKYNVSGNVLSLLYASDNDKSSQYKFYYYRNASIPNGCFSNFFYNDNNLIDASNLIIPDVTIGTYSFYQCFKGCTSMIKPPIGLYPSTLADHCYSHMFQNCIAMYEVPDLPALTLADYCYHEMFAFGEFYSSPINSSLLYPPELPATTLADSCYYRMFANNASLLTIPQLKSTNLTHSCYYEMFAGCTGLRCDANMGIFNNIVLDQASCAGMYKGCTSITYAFLATNCMGKSPNTNLGTSCCAEMFEGCTSLRYIHVSAQTKISADWDNSNSPTLDWVHNVAPTGTFVKYSGLDWPVDSDNGIPIGWTAINWNTVLYDFNVYNSNNIAGYVTKSPNTPLVHENTEVTVTATVVDNGFTFLGWKKNDGTYASYNSTYTFTATENINLTAMWSGEPATKYTLDIINTNTSAGTTSGAGKYTSGTMAKINAVPNNGWTFNRWEKTVNGVTETYDDTTPRNVLVNTNMTWTAYWNRIIEPKNEYLTITSLSNNNKLVIMIPQGSYNEYQWGQVALGSIEYRINDTSYWTRTGSTIYAKGRRTIFSADVDNDGMLERWNGIVFDLNYGDKIRLRYAEGGRDGGNMWDSPPSNYGGWWHFTIQCKYGFNVRGNMESLCPWSDYGYDSDYEYYDAHGTYGGGYWRRSMFTPIACYGDGEQWTATSQLNDSSDLWNPSEHPND